MPKELTNIKVHTAKHGSVTLNENEVALIIDTSDQSNGLSGSGKSWKIATSGGHAPIEGFNGLTMNVNVNKKFKLTPEEMARIVAERQA